ncbi:MAG: RNB domain-containing ribonuclease, partial [Myxococcota bacterium]
GVRFVALREARSDVERWNEQISLLANAEGARLLASLGDVPGVEPIYRVVEPPTPAQLDGLRATSDAVIAAHGLPDAWRWAVDEPLADWLARLPDDPVASALHRAAMLVGGAAVYQPTPGPHAGVGVDVYARFTAPMREVVGVFLHRELLDGLGGVRGTDGLRDEVIAAASRHRRLQRDVDRAVNELVLDQLFADDLSADRVRTAVVMGLSADKVHVTLDDPPIDAKVYLAHHPDWTVDGVSVRDGSGVRFRVGDAVSARVIGRIGERWALGLGAAGPG